MLQPQISIKIVPDLPRTGKCPDSKSPRLSCGVIPAIEKPGLIAYLQIAISALILMLNKSLFDYECLLHRFHVIIMNLFHRSAVPNPRAAARYRSVGQLVPGRGRYNVVKKIKIKCFILKNDRILSVTSVYHSLLTLQYALTDSSITKPAGKMSKKQTSLLERPANRQGMDP